MLRRNEAETAAGLDTDIMLSYSRRDLSIPAVYTDNEGNAIEYEVTVL